MAYEGKYSAANADKGNRKPRFWKIAIAVILTLAIIIGAAILGGIAMIKDWISVLNPLTEDPVDPTAVAPWERTGDAAGETVPEAIAEEK